MQTTAIAILNYNGKKYLEKYLPGVIQHSTNASIYVIDNASTDDSVEFMQKKYPEISLIVNDANYGFAGGYNKGLEHIQATYYVLLNSDIEVTPNWLDAPIAMLASNPNIAACQPKIRALTQPDFFEHAGAAGGFIDRYGYPFCRGRIFDHLEKDNGQYNTACEVFWATGACLFIKANMFKQAGGFDADFFAHMEEIDLCWRLKAMGYKIMVEPASIVYHLGGGTLNYMSPFKTKLNFRNNLILLQKNVQKNRFFILLWRMVLDGVAAFKFLVTGYWKHFWAIAKAHVEFYAALRKTKQKRKLFQPKLKQTGNDLTGWYKRNVVWLYFVKKIKTFSALPDQGLKS